MARRRRHRRTRGLGSILVTKRLGKLGSLKQPGTFMGSVLPVLLGAAAAVGTALGVRMYVQPTAGSLQAQLFKHAPWVGLVAGGASAFAMKMLAGKPAAFATGGGAAAGALTVFGYDLMAQRAASTAGLGAIVPEFSGTRGLGRGTGAVVFAPTPSAMKGLGRGVGAYGETVNLGKINSGAFGTPGFRTN